MALRPEEVTAILQRELEQFTPKLDMASVGTVLQVGDGIARGVARSARPLPAATLKSLEQRLGHRLGKHVVLTPAVDPSLIGGVAVSLDNTIFDGSVRRMLEVLREHLATVRVA